MSMIVPKNQVLPRRTAEKLDCLGFVTRSEKVIQLGWYSLICYTPQILRKWII